MAVNIAPCVDRYGDAMKYDPESLPETELAAARAAVQAVREAEEAVDRALAVREQRVRDLYAAAPEGCSQNELARLVDLSPSTFRDDLPADRPRKRRRRG